MFCSRAIWRNKRIMKNKRIIMTMKVKEQHSIVLFMPKQLEVLLKMNRPNFTWLVEALKRRSSKSARFKPTKPENFDGSKIERL
jgi:hypothetical protein